MGRFTVRLPDTLHSELELQARHEGVSLNQFIVYALTKKTTPAYTIQMFPDTDVQQQRNRFNTLLEQLGPPDQAVTREFLDEREVEQPEDEETVELIAKVKAKLVG